MIKGRDIDQVAEGKEQSSAKLEQWASYCICCMLGIPQNLVEDK